MSASIGLGNSFGIRPLVLSEANLQLISLENLICYLVNEVEFRLISVLHLNTAMRERDESTFLNFTGERKKHFHFQSRFTGLS